MVQKIFLDWLALLFLHEPRAYWVFFELVGVMILGSVWDRSVVLSWEVFHQKSYPHFVS